MFQASRSNRLVINEDQLQTIFSKQKLCYWICYPDRRHGNNLWLWFHYPTPISTSKAKSGQIYSSYLGQNHVKFSIISNIMCVSNYFNNYFECFFLIFLKSILLIVVYYFLVRLFSGGTLYKSALLLLGSSFSPLAPFRSIAQWRCEFSSNA